MQDRSFEEREGENEQVYRAKRRVPDENRKRARLACAVCKLKKTKCNGYTPCSECIRRKNPASCVYSSTNSLAISPFKHLPRANSTSSTTLLQPTPNPTTLQKPPSQDPYPYSFPSAKSSSSPSQSDILKELLLHVDFGKQDVLYSVQSFLEKNQQSNKQKGSLLLPDTNDNDDPSRPPVSEENSVNETYISQLLPDKLGKLRYIGESGFLSFVEQVRRWVSAKEKALGNETKNVANLFVQDGFRRVFDDNLNRVSGSSPWNQYCHRGGEALIWLSKEQMSRLVKHAEEGNPISGLFFTRSDCEEWISKMGSWELNEGRSHIISTIVLYLVFALGLLYGSRDALPGVPENKADSLLETADQLRKEYLTDDDGGLSVVQVYALTALASLSLLKRQACWMQLGRYSS